MPNPPKYKQPARTIFSCEATSPTIATDSCREASSSHAILRQVPHKPSTVLEGERSEGQAISTTLYQDRTSLIGTLSDTIIVVLISSHEHCVTPEHLYSLLLC